jgi:hypothetical protein
MERRACDWGAWCHACLQAVKKELEERSTAGKLKSFEKVLV